MFHDLKITDLNKTVALFVEPHKGAISPDFHTLNLVHGVRFINAAKALITDHLSEDESVSVTESSNGTIKIEAVLKSSMYSPYVSNPWSMCYPPNADTPSESSIFGGGHTVQFKCNEELDPIYQDPFARMLLYRIVAMTTSKLEVGPRPYQDSNFPPTTLVLKEIYDTTKATVTEWLSRSDVTLPDGTTPTWLQLAYRMTSVGSFDMLTRIFFQQHPVDRTKFYPLPTTTNAILLNSQLNEAPVDDHMLYNTINMHSQIMSSNCYRFVNADNYWIWANPENVMRTIFGEDFSGLPEDDTLKLSERERVLKCMQHIKQHLVDAVLEYNKTCESASDCILQTTVLDHCNCLEVPQLRAFIAHYRSMYNINTPKYETMCNGNKPEYRNMAGYRDMNDKAVDRIAKVYKEVL